VQWFAVAVFILVVVLFGGLGLRLAEAQEMSLSDTLWWAVMSLVAGEPIGAVPETALGRLVAVSVMIAGLTVFAMLTGVISAMMVHRLGNIDTRAMDIDELEDHIIICGWNRSGFNIVEELQNDREYQDRCIVLVGEFEETPQWPPTIPFPDRIYMVKGDFTRMEVLERAGLIRASHVIVLADRLVERSDQDRDARTVLTAMLAERIKPEIFTSVELLNRENETFLRTVGVDEIVVGTEYAASIIATSTRNKGIVGVFDELLTSRYGNQLYKVPVPETLSGKSYGELVTHLKESFDAMLIGLEWPDEADAGVDIGPKGMDINPPNDRVVRSGMCLVVIARKRPRWTE